MPPDCLTVLAPIKPGETDALRAVLRPIGDDINGTHLPAGGRPHIAFTQSRAIHFARFAILTDPDRGPDRARLLYASVYDGSLEAHVAELAALSSDLDAIWGRVEGYTGRDGFVAFLRPTPTNRRPTTSRSATRRPRRSSRRLPRGRPSMRRVTPARLHHRWPNPACSRE